MTQFVVVTFAQFQICQFQCCCWVRYVKHLCLALRQIAVQRGSYRDHNLSLRAVARFATMRVAPDVIRGGQCLMNGQQWFMIIVKFMYACTVLSYPCLRLTGVHLSLPATRLTGNSLSLQGLDCGTGFWCRMIADNIIMLLVKTGDIFLL